MTHLQLRNDRADIAMTKSLLGWNSFYYSYFNNSYLGRYLVSSPSSKWRYPVKKGHGQSVGEMVGAYNRKCKSQIVAYNKLPMKKYPEVELYY